MDSGALTVYSGSCYLSSVHGSVIWGLFGVIKGLPEVPKPDTFLVHFKKIFFPLE